MILARAAGCRRERKKPSKQVVTIIVVLSPFIVIISITIVTTIIPNSSMLNRLVGLVVKASASRAGGPGFESR